MCNFSLILSFNNLACMSIVQELDLVENNVNPWSPKTKTAIRQVFEDS